MFVLFNCFSFGLFSAASVTVILSLSILTEFFELPTSILVFSVELSRTFAKLPLIVSFVLVLEVSLCTESVCKTLSAVTVTTSSAKTLGDKNAKPTNAEANPTPLNFLRE